MMSVKSEEEFRDQGLKEAVRRCWSCDCASEELRRRVAELLAKEKSAGSEAVVPQRSPMRIGVRRPWLVLPLAAAAALLISVLLLDRFDGSASIAPVVPPPANTELASLETNLIRTHNRCCKLENHQGLPVPKNNDGAIADALRGELKQPVLVYHPQDPNWKFLGASVCRVGKTDSGHLVFVKGADALSIFSLPKKLWSEGKEGSEFSTTVEGHPIVGFVKDDALFCVVGSGPAGTVTLDELEQMSQQMKPAVASGPGIVPAEVVLTELLKPIR